MVDNELQLKIYCNSRYGKNGRSYLIYCNGGGIYFTSSNKSFKVVKHDEIGKSSIGDFARSRGFKHILDVVYHNYDMILVGSEPYSKTVLKDYLERMIEDVTFKAMNDNDPSVRALYSRIFLLLKKL